MALRLVIGNKNYSSWSLRPWLLMKQFGLEFEEIQIPLFTAGYEEAVRRYSPTGKVPVLIDEDLTVWESLAIGEYLNETYLDDQALPKGREARALCRSYCHEMHAGFAAIRSQLPMNCRAQRELDLTPAVKAEIGRVATLWSKARRRFVGHGDYLFGRFSLADCLFAPVVLRFRTYGVSLVDESQEYFEFMLDNPFLALWVEAAKQETATLPAFEVGKPSVS